MYVTCTYTFMKSICLYASVHGTYTFINVNVCLYMVQTRLYHITTTLHSPSGPNAGESQLSAGSTPSEQPPSCHQSFQLTDHPGVACHVQTATASGLPHTHCCHAGHQLLQCPAHLEGRPLVLVVLVRNGRGRVTSQEQGDQGTLPTMQADGATYRQGVGKGSYKLVTLHQPADGQFQHMYVHCIYM
jgi:hypothetical protein